MGKNPFNYFQCFSTSAGLNIPRDTISWEKSLHVYKRNCESPIKPAQSTVKGYASEWVTGHRDGLKNALCPRAYIYRGKCVHTPQDGPFGAHSSWDCGLGMDGSGQKPEAKFLVLLWESKLAAWGEVNSGMKVPMFHKMSIIRLEVSSHPFTPTYSYSPFSYW
jgi:hypothetical protein